MVMQQPGQILSFSNAEQMTLASGVAMRLLMAALLGGLIGFDRELHQKPSGLRTNLLICSAAALFTFLSPIIAGEGSSNKAQIASNIVQGIGFLGAGLILQNRNRVSGLTSAATVFAVASIGMACGAGLYLCATLAAATVLIVLEGVGVIEKRFNLKLYLRIYEVRGSDANEIETEDPASDGQRGKAPRRTRSQHHRRGSAGDIYRPGHDQRTFAA